MHEEVGFCAALRGEKDFHKRRYRAQQSQLDKRYERIWDRIREKQEVPLWGLLSQTEAGWYDRFVRKNKTRLVVNWEPLTSFLLFHDCMGLCILISFSIIFSHTMSIQTGNLLLMFNFIIWSMCGRMFRLDLIF